MPDYIPPACDRCGAAPANNRLVYATLGISENLCDRCHSQENWQFAESADGMTMFATCQYCGGLPKCGGTDAFEMMIGGSHKFRWMCSSCATEFYTVYLQKLTEALHGAKINISENGDLADVLKSVEAWLGVETSSGEEKLNTFMAKLGEFSQILPPEQQIAVIKKVKAEIEDHMIRFVAERNQ